MKEFCKHYWWLFLIFLLAVGIRFLYFPNNIYFGYDQARDAYVVQELIAGNLRLVGPTTLIDGLFHGPLYYYLFAPVYFFSSGNPEWVSAFLRVVNAAGVFNVFAITAILFNKKSAFIASIIYAFSFEQTQFSIYLNHPSLSIQAVLLFYLGLSILFFRRKWWGLLIAMFGLGLSIQFEFPLIYLVPGFVLLLGVIGVYSRQLPQLSIKQILLSVTTFLLVISSFILAEIKFNFKGVSTLFYGILFSGGGEKPDYLHNIGLISSRFIQDSLFSFYPLFFGILLLGIASYFIWKRKYSSQIIFLLIWFGMGIVPYLKNTATIPLYYYSGGAAISGIIFVSFLLSTIFSKNRLIAVVLLLVVLSSNLIQIQKFNPFGTIPSINVQSGMLWSEQKKVVDYVYQEADGQPFAVNALSVPLNVNMVWSYVFEQFGERKYGYLPVWGGDAAAGYYGNLKVEKARSELPNNQYLILEPTRGIEQYLIDDFMKNENLFTTSVQEVEFGLIKLQTRQKI